MAVKGHLMRFEVEPFAADVMDCLLQGLVFKRLHQAAIVTDNVVVMMA